uniref:Uncharacterized protein n=1 Tax=Rhizophora mucronata TaxID=61149 RepID=A0A2P2K7M9_RHIMU
MPNYFLSCFSWRSAVCLFPGRPSNLEFFGCLLICFASRSFVDSLCEKKCVLHGLLHLFFIYCIHQYY